MYFGIVLKRVWKEIELCQCNLMLLFELIQWSWIDVTKKFMPVTFEKIYPVTCEIIYMRKSTRIASHHLVPVITSLSFIPFYSFTRPVRVIAWYLEAYNFPQKLGYLK